MRAYNKLPFVGSGCYKKILENAKWQPWTVQICEFITMSTIYLYFSGVVYRQICVKTMAATLFDKQYILKQVATVQHPRYIDCTGGVLNEYFKYIQGYW